MATISYKYRDYNLLVEKDKKDKKDKKQLATGHLTLFEKMKSKFQSYNKIFQKNLWKKWFELDKTSKKKILSKSYANYEVSLLKYIPFIFIVVKFQI